MGATNLDMLINKVILPKLKEKFGVTNLDTSDLKVKIDDKIHTSFYSPSKKTIYISKQNIRDKYTFLEALGEEITHYLFDKYHGKDRTEVFDNLLKAIKSLDYEKIKKYFEKLMIDQIISEAMGFLGRYALFDSLGVPYTIPNININEIKEFIKRYNIVLDKLRFKLIKEVLDTTFLEKLIDKMIDNIFTYETKKIYVLETYINEALDKVNEKKRK